MVKESVEDVQRRQIDEFLTEFRGFDAKLEKQRLKIYQNRLQELHRHMNSELFSTAKNKPEKYTRAFWKLKEEIKTLGVKLKKYEDNKDMVDSFARTHKKYVFEKHGFYV